jgi:hypothetical protein
MQNKFSISLIVTLLIFSSYNCFAQSIYKGLNTSNSTFLLGATNARKSQCLYKPSDFNALPNFGEITKIYYRYGTTGITAPHDLSPFTIKLGQTNDTVFANGTIFFTNLTTVRFDSVFTIPAGVQGDWFGIDLQSPFPYDSTKTLIVEIKFYDTSEPAFGTLGNNNTTQKLISADTGAVAETGFGSTTWQDFGFDYTITTGKANLFTNNELIVFPNPSKGLITINNLGIKNSGNICVFNLFGQLVLNKHFSGSQTSESIDLSMLEQGMYLLKIESNKQVFYKKIQKI